MKERPEEASIRDFAWSLNSKPTCSCGLSSCASRFILPIPMQPFAAPVSTPCCGCFFLVFTCLVSRVLLVAPVHFIDPLVAECLLCRVAGRLEHAKTQLESALALAASVLLLLRFLYSVVVAPTPSFPIGHPFERCMLSSAFQKRLASTLVCVLLQYRCF
jgi:hypothetical protein